MTKLPIRRALISLSDKTHIEDLVRVLTEFGVELISTGGTRQLLAAKGFTVKDISEVTHFPEMLDGRVKTLHPKIHGGLLGRRDLPEHLQTMEEHGIEPIDMVVCNLYPFAQTLAKQGVTEEELIENIDIGGPSMLRSASKNFVAVAVVTSPSQYGDIVAELKANQGSLTLHTRRQLAAAAFQMTATYDSTIANYFAKEESTTEFAPHLQINATLSSTLRYGENNHQKAALYLEPGVHHACVATARQLHGKELSYNNILDVDSAFNLVREFAPPAVVVVKHNNPCGAASAPTLVKAFEDAWAGDPKSAFGGILAFNRPLDEETANLIAEPGRFVECIIAPGFEPKAVEILTTKPTWKANVRLLTTPEISLPPQGWDYRRVDGGMLVQNRDVGADHPETWKVVSKRQPTPEELEELKFAWLVCKHVKSNAIVLARGTKIVGVGAGQMSRVDSTEIAIKKAGELARGSALASDAFFPFRDNVDQAAGHGVQCLVQPGGSMRDQESIEAANEHNMVMLFTGIRHFRH
ncbi:MAG: bifunctional phosphoribosylaminoimidazolecarboxamide formyltransferase/IMP cyclohydrolase [Zavarzinella sp.]